MRRDGELAAIAAAFRYRPGGCCSREYGIDTVLDNPAVGGNLQDHLAVVYSFKASRPTLNDELNSRIGRTIAGVRYLLSRTGPVSLSVNQFGGFVRANPQASRPDVQLYFNPVTYQAGDATRTRIQLDAFSGFYLCFQPTRPTSTGRIDIASGDFRTPPAIAPNYLSTEKDVADVGHGGRLMQAIARTRAMQNLIREPLAPDLLRMSDADLIADFRARAATVYHPVGTCRMGRPRRAQCAGPKPAGLRGRPHTARARDGALARRRCLGFSDGHLGQHQRTDAHGGSEGRRSDRGRMRPANVKDEIRP